MRYRIFSRSLAWFGAICNGLPRVTVKFILKMYINIFLKTCGNALKLWLHVALWPIHVCRI